MITKICTKCGTEKEINQFNKGKNKDGLRSWCKQCVNDYSKDYDKTHKEKIKEKSRRHYEKNKEKINERGKIYNKTHKPSKEKIKGYNRKQYLKNREKRLEQQKINYQNNKEKIKKESLDYYYNNKEKRLKQIKDNRKKYPEKENARRRKYSKKRRKSDINYKIKCNLRGRLHKFIKGKIKAGSAVRDLGCSIEEFKQYIEKKFYPHPVTGEMMTWSNYGTKWEFDHIYPLSMADLTDKIQFLWVCHYTNIQPLWKEENLKKSNKIL